jgi:hypothetical protein
MRGRILRVVGFAGRTDLKVGSSSSDSEDELVGKDPAAVPMGGQWEHLYRKEAEAFDNWPE